MCGHRSLEDEAPNAGSEDDGSPYLDLLQPGLSVKIFKSRDQE